MTLLRMTFQSSLGKNIKEITMVLLTTMTKSFLITTDRSWKIKAWKWKPKQHSYWINEKRHNFFGLYRLYIFPFFLDIIGEGGDSVLVGVLARKAARTSSIWSMRNATRSSCCWLIHRVSRVFSYGSSAIFAVGAIGAGVARDLFWRSCSTCSTSQTKNSNF